MVRSTGDHASQGEGRDPVPPLPQRPSVGPGYLAADRALIPLNRPEEVLRESEAAEDEVAQPRDAGKTVKERSSGMVRQGHRRVREHEPTDSLRQPRANLSRDRTAPILPDQDH